MTLRLQKSVDGKKRIRANITIEKLLLETLMEYKKKNDIKQLSPMINEMLWEWFQQQEMEGKKK